MIHICFSLYDKTGHYSKFTGTAILSILENCQAPPQSISIHILHDNTLTENNRDKFISLVNSFYQLVKFYNVEKLCADKIAQIRELFPNVDKTRFSIGMFYRFFIPHVLPAEIEKVIYCDADIIVNLDITELWQIELGDKPFGAVPNKFYVNDDKASAERNLKAIQLCQDGFVKPEDYFFSGGLLMNLNFMRNAEQTLIDGMKFLNEQNQLQYPDQDVLNYCFSTSYLRLPAKFNSIVKNNRENNEFSIGKEIIHYAGGQCSFTLDLDDPYNRLWWSYFIRTEWFGVDTIHNILKGTLDSILKTSSDKDRAFVVDEEHAYQIEKNFSIRQDEDVIIVDPKSKENLNQIFDLMTAERGKKVFFIGIPNITSNLKKMEFVEGRDFFNVSAYYSPVWANLKNNYELISAM